MLTCITCINHLIIKLRCLFGARLELYLNRLCVIKAVLKISALDQDKIVIMTGKYSITGISV